MSFQIEGFVTMAAAEQITGEGRRAELAGQAPPRPLRSEGRLARKPAAPNHPPVQAQPPYDREEPEDMADHPSSHPTTTRRLWFGLPAVSSSPP